MIEELTSIADWAATLRITKSQLQTYLICPRKFFYQYVTAAAWEFMPANLPFGRAIHATVADFYKHLLAGNAKPDLDWLLDDWRMNWAMESTVPDIEYAEGETAETFHAQGEGLLKRFHADVEPRRIEAVEHPFSVDVIDPDTGQPLEQKLVGVIDLIESDEEGNLIVSELKTAKARMADSKSEQQLDGLIYAYAMDQLGRRTTDHATLVRYDVLVKTKTPGFQQVYVTKDAGDYRMLGRWIKQILQAIERESFYPQLGWACKGCQFAKQCREGMVQ